MKHRLANRKPLVTALAGIILSFSGMAHACAVDSPDSGTLPKAKTGELNITVPTAVGGVTLEPGDYELKPVNSAAGPVIRFTRITQTPFPQEGLPLYESETVAQLAVTTQPLASKATSTLLLPASDGGHQIGLEIRGNSYEYLFCTTRG